MPVLALDGEIDLHYAPVLRSLLGAKIKESCPALVLDLSKVSFIDSTGFAALLEYARDSAAFSGALCLVGLRPPVWNAFAIARLDQAFQVFPARVEAAAALNAHSVRPAGPLLFH